MEKREIHELHPFGWETDPAEERFKLSTIDLTPNCAYNHYVLFFRLEEERSAEVEGVLKKGLERTLRYVSIFARENRLHLACDDDLFFEIFFHQQRKESFD